MKKLFICHATEDKAGFVRPLAEALKEHFSVWYDEYELVVGTSLLEEISKGLGAADYGVVVLSPHFFAKKWTQQELNGLFALEEVDRKVILPIWKDVTQPEVRKYSPILADRVAVMASQGVAAVVAEIERSIEFFDRGKAVQRGSVAIKRLSSALSRKAEATASDSALRTASGVSTVNQAVKHFVSRANETVAELVDHSPACGIRVDTPKLHDHHSYINFWHGRICLRFEYANDVVNSASDARLRCLVIEGRWGRFNNYGGANVIHDEEYSPFITADGSVRWKDDEGNSYGEDALIDEWLGKYTDEIEEQLG